MSYDTPPPSEPYGTPDQPPAATGKGFFGALFDRSFDYFVTPMIVKVVYVLAMVALGLALLVFIVVALVSGELSAILLAVVLGPIGALLYLCLIRMTLEFYLAITRMSQDIHQRLR